MTAPLLKGTAFLTGAASGIGRGTAFAFVKNGITNLALADINHAMLLDTCNEIKAQHANIEIEAIQIDVCDEKSVNAAVDKAVARFGRIDVAVNLAGIAGNGESTHESEESGWAKVLDVNLNGVWRCQRAEIRAMLKQEDLGKRIGRGTIINIASILGLTGPPSILAASAYTASKHGVLGLTKSDATMYAPHSIRINAICPGYVDTALIAEAKAVGLLDPEIEKTPMGRMAHVDEIADCLVFMSSQMASFMCGSGLVVDGGYLAN